MDKLANILAATKMQAEAGTDRIAFEPMSLAHAIETGIAHRLAAEQARWTEAVMVELDSNGQAHAIVAAATRAERQAEIAPCQTIKKP